MPRRHGLRARGLLLSLLLSCGGGISPTATPDAGHMGASSGASGPGSSGGPSGSGGNSASSSGGLGDARGGSSSGGSITLDGSAVVGDASIEYDVAPPGLAGFALIINHLLQHPMTCPSDNWEFLGSSNGMANGDQCSFMAPFGCSGVTSAVLVNTGQLPMAYIAASLWNGTGYVPGVLTGDPSQLVGVLNAGAQVDITSVYNGGIVAVLGSADPFSSPAAAKYESDEGTIPWPAGVAGSGGATQMQVAEIEMRTSCGVANVVW